MALLNTHHEDEASAALSIAANRASKVRKLRESAEIARNEGQSHTHNNLRHIAERYELDLLRDVVEFISDGSVQSGFTYRHLANLALQALPEDES